ncbi:glycoside hydrolase family 97 protein [Flammeovirga sp. OC4]|uniref:glycoside hydrolase family 97 protein n=1 Tax=Flammeovirga sp. OC4 TaxID=1382345 RepID=UPI0005C735E6|nr:glycoside hydrolase family 97 protein [Flammeovirga sp. OC4]
MKRIVLVFLLALSFCFSASAKEWVLHSPDNKNEVKVIFTGGKLFYEIKREGETLITKSSLGLTFKQFDLSQFKQVKQVSTNSVNEKWEMIWGEQKEVVNNYHEAQWNALTKNKDKLVLEFRIFNDGVSFRYKVLNDEGKHLDLLDEKTAFNLPENPETWWIHADYDSYELLYQKTQLSEVDSAHTPMTMELNSGVHVSIHEAALIDYASMTLKNNGQGVDCDLVPWADGIKVKKDGDLISPWRTVIIGDNAGDLVESTMVLNLNEPNVLKETDWIQPMRYMGIWWDMHLNTRGWKKDEKHGATTEYAKEYIDFASKNGFEGLLVEGWNIGWEKWDNWNFTEAYDDFDIEEVQRYAQENGMTLIGHHETGGKVAYQYEPQMEEAFKLYHRLGIKAVKTGYVGKIDNGEYHHGQWMVNHYQRVVDLGAKYKVAIIAHEPIKATGLRRTYPHFLAREGVRGQEYNAWAYPSNPPEHTVILPFTRGLAGPIDFTPGAFRMTFDGTYREEGYPSRVSTTLAKQLALYVTMYSPVQMACDLPKHYEEFPEMFQFITHVPVNWEESKVLNASIGEYYTVARKDRDTPNWYIGSITNENSRDLTIQLDFLEEGKMYQMTHFEDGENADWEFEPYNYRISNKMVKKGDTVQLTLAPGGGTAIRLEQINR